MELKIYLNILLKKWWIVLSTFLVTVTAGVIFAYTQPSIYSATATYVVVPSSSFDTVSAFAGGLDMLGRRMEIATTFAEISMSRRIKEEAAKALSLQSNNNYSVNSELRAGTNILEFTVAGPDPALVRDLANAIGITTEQYVKDSYEVFMMRPLDEAIVSGSPISPKRALNVILSAIFGLILGGGLAFLSKYLETSTHSILDINIIDNQTGVYNRGYFLQRLGSEMIRAKRNRYPLSVALLRIDNLGLLKGIQPAKARAEVLQQVATLMTQYLREEDMVARLKDDVFGVTMPDTSGENARAVMEYLQTRIGWVSFRPTDGGPSLKFKSAVGVAAYNHNGTSCDDLVAPADRALRLAEVNENGSTYLISEAMVAADNGHA